MAKISKGSNGDTTIQSKPKMTTQGCSRNTNLAATPNRPKRRRYRGQGK